MHKIFISLMIIGRVEIMYKDLIEVIASKREVREKGIYFIQNEEKEEYLSYRDLLKEAWNLKEDMLKSGIPMQSEVILQDEESRSFLISFWACILGRMIPVPLSAQKGKESLERVLKIYRQLRNPYILTNDARMRELRKYAKEKKIGALKFFLHTKSFEFSAARNLDEILLRKEELDLSCDAESVAFIQFSSGSTGEPKGIEITHRNIMENCKGMVKSSEIEKTDSVLSWMPLYHNLGLIVSHLLGIVCTLDSYLMSTELFIYQPHLWMEKVSEHKVTLTCSPNFGYRYYLRNVMNRELTKLDLSNLRIILNGAEPISLQACNTFLEMMKPYGLKETVFQTGYGLAEATVSVTSTFVGRNLESLVISGENQGIGQPVRFLKKLTKEDYAVELVKVGRPHFNTEIRVVDEEGQPLSEHYFGQVQVRGPIIMKGYYTGEEQREKAVTKDGWLDTGDIGFLDNGQLVISGRKKDIIFVNGKNFYCHDLEGVIREEHPNCECAICGIFQKELERDQIILFLVKGDKSYLKLRKMGDSMRKRITRRTGLVVDNVVLIQEIPKTESGKIQRFRLKELFQKGMCTDLYVQDTKTQVIAIIQEQVKKVLGFSMEDLDESLVEAGLNSMKAATFQKYLSQAFEMDIPVSIVFDYSSVRAIAGFIMGEKHENIPVKQAHKGDEIAVIGMACQFPKGADTLQLYWKKLLDGYDGITEVPEEREELKKYCQKENITLYGGFLQGIDKFDAAFFGVTPKEAMYLDPQQRLLLQNAYRALEDACVDMKKIRGSRTGVFIGLTNSEYKEIMPKEENSAYMLSGNMNSMAAGRISYVFDLQGPSAVIDTACSSSLVAVHEAVQSLRTGESDMALAGGANCIFSPLGYRGLKELNALSPTGRCHAFDESADGYIRSEGCGVVVLKRFQDALKDGDYIYAVIKGSAVNSDGKSSGLTAPNGTSQVKVMNLALADAGVDASEISYIETHGTGTKLGDPQEIYALNQVYGKGKETVFLGAVKTNIGHTESAAGIASFIKTVLSVSTGKIPANQGFRTPNHLIPWDNMRFEVPTSTIDWNVGIRVAALSSFGLSGTNAHLILEQYRGEEESTDRQEEMRILTISSKKKELLLKDMKNMQEFLEKTEEPLGHLLFTANRCRAEEKYKIGVAAATKEGLIKCLKKRMAEEGEKRKETGQKIAFLCGGIQEFQKKQIQRLYENNFVFGEAWKECSDILYARKSIRLTDLLYGAGKLGEKEELFLKMAAEYGIYKTVSYYGIKPDVVIGHRNGEWIASVIAGCLTLEQAFFFAEIMEQVKERYGVKQKAVLVYQSFETFRKKLEKESLEGVFIIAQNTEENLVVAYCREEEFFAFLEREKVLYTTFEKYKVTIIKDTEEAVKEFYKRTEMETVSHGEIPYFSTTAGLEERITGNKRNIWASMLTKKAQVLKTIQATERMGCDLYLECNVQPYLSALTAQNLQEEKEILPLIRRQGNEEIQIREAIAKLYEMGIKIDFALEGIQSDHITKLPIREWKQKKYWFK